MFVFINGERQAPDAFLFLKNPLRLVLKKNVPQGQEVIASYEGLAFFTVDYISTAECCGENCCSNCLQEDK